MLEIMDDRYGTEINLCNVVFGGFFLYDGGLFRRLDPAETPLEIVGITDEQIPVMFMRTGEIAGLDRLKMVEPVKCRLVIVDD